MLKKSKRTLSLVLALIMICSTMGVMAFAAEGNPVLELRTEFRDSIDNVMASAQIRVIGYFCEEDNIAEIWDVNCHFTGPEARMLSVSEPLIISGRNATLQLLWGSYTIVVFQFQISSDGEISYDWYRYSGAPNVERVRVINY